MPIPLPSHNFQKNLSLARFGDYIVVSSNNSDLNTHKFEIVSKTEGAFFTEPSYDSDNSEFERLSPTLMDPTLMYRYEHVNESIKTVELWEFEGGDFLMKKRFLSPPPHLSRYDCVMLNDRFWVQERRRSHLDFIDLVTSQIFAVKLPDYRKFRLFVQDSTCYLVDTYSHTVHHRVVFDDNNEPRFDNDHPLMGIEYVALDVTPGRNKFVVKKNEEFWSLKVFETEVFEDDRYCDLYIGESVDDHIEFVRFNGLILHRPGYQTASGGRRSVWNFVDLAGKTCCTEYDTSTGVARFSPVYRCDLRGLFVIEAQTSFSSWKFGELQLFDIEQRPSNVIFDLCNKSLMVFEPCSEKKGLFLRDASRFFDFKAKEWRTRCVVVDENTETYHTYVDGEETGKFSIIDCEVPKFNDKHTVIPCMVEQDTFDVYVNGELQMTVIWEFSFGVAGCYEVSGDYIWVICDSGNLSALKMGNDGAIETKTLHIGGKVSRILCNPYDGGQAIVVVAGRRSRQYFYVNYGDDDKVMDVFSDFMFMRGCSPYFVDTGVFVSYDTVYAYNQLAKKSELKLPNIFLENHVISPGPGIIACYERNWGDFQVKAHMITFNQDYTGLSENETLIFSDEFFTECFILTFSTFSEFHEEVVL
ncbi:hypothetical protein PCE1_000773 [Barthelona sp. PCE]